VVRARVQLAWCRTQVAEKLKMPLLSAYAAPLQPEEKPSAYTLVGAARAGAGAESTASAVSAAAPAAASAPLREGGMLAPRRERRCKRAGARS
jgi:hypothetical protein